MATRDFPPRPQGAEADSVPFQNWLDALGNRQNIDLQQELTSVASGDELLVFDVSETGNVKTKKATVSNVGSTIAGGGFAGSFTTVTATGLVDISASGAGQIKFPATQNASSDANTLDDYEEGTYTPTLTFSTPGDLSITYSARVGYYTKIGRLVTCQMRLLTSAFTFTTASGNSSVTGYPFTALNVTDLIHEGTLAFGGVTKAGYTNSVMQMQPNTSAGLPVMSGSGVANATINAADMPSGGTVNFLSTLSYITA